MIRALAVLLAVAAALPGRAAEIDDLLHQVVEAYGGPAAVKRLESFRAEIEVTSRLQGGLGRGRRDYRSPDKLRVEIAYPRTTEVRALDGARGWRGTDGKLERVDGAAKLSMVYQLLRSTVPESLVRHRTLLELRADQEKDGVAYRILGLPWSEELDLAFWVEPKTHRVIWVVGALAVRGAQTGFATNYRDFREVDGVLFAFAEENYASGQHTGSTVVRSVRFSPGDLGPFDPTRL